MNSFDLEAIAQQTNLARVVFENSMESTNDVALQFAETNPEHPFLVLTDRQTKGRGQREKTWWSSEDSLTFSWVQQVKDRWSDANLLVPLASALAVMEAIEATSSLSRLKIKWPNDILIDDQKLCGILVESTSRSVVIGIGINVNQTEVPSMESAVPPTSIAIHHGSPIAKTDLLVHIINHLQNEFVSLGTAEIENQTINAIVDRCNERLAFQNQTVTIQEPGGNHWEGFCQAITSRGGLKMKTEEETIEIFSGTILTI